MPTNWPTSIDTPHDPVSGESMASGQPGDLAQEITNLNDRTVAIENGIGSSTAQGLMVGYRLISRQVIGSAVASVTFSSIPGFYENLHLMWNVQNSTSTTSWLALQLNGIATANYDAVLGWTEGAAAGAAGAGGVSDNGVTSARIGIVSGTATANQASSGRLSIPNYARASLIKAWFTSGMCFSGVGATGFYETSSGGQLRTLTTAVTSLTILAQAANINPNSVLSLYGEG